MGLDSVEFVMDVENFFNIQIPGQEAEGIVTIQDMVDCIARHLDIQGDDKSLRDMVFKCFSKSIYQVQGGGNSVALADKIEQYLPLEDTPSWTRLETIMGYTLPRPENFIPNGKKFRDRFKQLPGWTPNYDWHSIPVAHFIDSVCAKNCRQLVSIENLKSKYEVYVSVIGLTVAKIGVDYYEISAGKSFADDLGVE